VKYSVAIGAYGPQISDWIDLIFLLQVRKFSQMMHMNHAFTMLAVEGFHTTSTSDAVHPIVVQTRRPCITIALVCINLDM
jgi:hypothetical protein